VSLFLTFSGCSEEESLSFPLILSRKITEGGKQGMAKVELKQPIIDEIKALLDGAVAATVVDYRGLTVAEDTALRKALREAGVQYKVFKNTATVFPILKQHSIHSMA